MITIKFRGIELLVPLENVGEVTRQLDAIAAGTAHQSLPTDAESKPPPRRRVELKEDTPLNPQAAWPFPTMSKKKDAPSAESGGEPQEQSAVPPLAFKFLKAIRHHHATGGMLAEQVAHILGVAHTKGIGSKTAAINKLLGTLGYHPTAVYTNDRDSNGDRHWLASPFIDHAIEAVSKEMSRA